MSNRVLFKDRMQLAEQWRRDWVVIAEEGTTVEEVLSPSYWAHVAFDMEPFNRIEVRVETGEWMLDLVAVQVEKHWAKMHVLHRYELVAQDDAQVPPSGLVAKWRSQHHQWCVVRVSDGAVLQKGMPNRPSAVEWIANYEQAVAA